MRIAHFIQRYPPALGGSEAYFARLSRTLAGRGDSVTVFTSNAIELEAFWSQRGQCVAPGISMEDGAEVRRYGLWTWPGRRYLLKLLSLIPQRRWQCLTLPCNPISVAMWRDSRYSNRPIRCRACGGISVCLAHRVRAPHWRGVGACRSF